MRDLLFDPDMAFVGKYLISPDTAFGSGLDMVLEDMVREGMVVQSISGMFTWARIKSLLVVMR